MTHDQIWNSDLLFLLLSFFFLLFSYFKSLTLTNNELHLGFPVSQQSLSSGCEVSGGSDVCNLIWAQRESPVLPSDPWPGSTSSHLPRDETQSRILNAARPPSYLSYVQLQDHYGIFSWFQGLFWCFFFSFCSLAFLIVSVCFSRRACLWPSCL